MARTVEFTWNEVDQTVVTFFSDLKSRETSTGLDLTSTEDYRLKTKGQVFEGMKAPAQFTLTCEINEDIDFDLSSSFTTPDDILPGLGKFGRINNLLTGSSAQILNIFQVPTWEKTEPVSLNLKPILYTRRNAILDCLIPAWSLASLTILKYDGKSFRTPGVWLGSTGESLARQQKPAQRDQPAGESHAAGQNNATNVEAGTKGTAQQNAAQKLKDGLAELNKGSNFVKVRIPGIISFTGILKSCKPTFSRHVTESGGPLWVMLDMKIEGAIPASSIELFSELTQLSSGNGNISSSGPNNSISNRATTVFK